MKIRNKDKIFLILLIFVWSFSIYYTLYSNDNIPFENQETSNKERFLPEQSNSQIEKVLKYIVYECNESGKYCGGFADRLKGILTTYAISLLTDRQFVIHMTKPCNIQEFLKPNEINWNIEIPHDKNLTQFLFHIYWDLSFVNSELEKINFLQFNKEADIIVVRTGLQLIKQLTFNPNHHKKIASLGYKIEEFTLETRLNEWFKRLFKLDSSILNEYESFLKDLSSSDLVCAQIRLGDKHEKPFALRNSTKLYWNLIHNTFLPNLDKYKLFVTSDNQDVISEAFNEFGRNNLIAFKEHSGHSDMLEEKECEKMRGVILDFVILGNCKMAVISHSGFGILGVLNRKNTECLKENFYVYTNPFNLKQNFWNRNNLSFHKFSKSLLYLEY